MPLIERVSTLLRANLNEMLDRAEDPEATLKQLVLDMENQLLQVKTQVAIALADRHLLEKKVLEQEQNAAAWRRKAETAVGEADDVLARRALQRALGHEQTANAYRRQIAEGAAEAETLRSNYSRLEAKLNATRAECERLLTQHRKNRLLTNFAASRAAAQGRVAPLPPDRRPSLGRAEHLIRTGAQNAEAGGDAHPQESREGQANGHGHAARVEELLADLKDKARGLREAG